MDTAELVDCLLRCNERDVDMHIHLVGDRAFRVACDAVEAARDQCAASSVSWHVRVTLAHCELVDPSDMHRPAGLGIIVNWTPHWSGGYFGEGARDHLGTERWDRMYRFAEIADAGATLTFGSDVVTEYELGRGAPLLGMQVAVTRVDPDQPVDTARYAGGIRPPASAALPVSLLLDGYTVDAARQLRREDEIGSLAVGKAATLCVLAEDPLSTPPERLAGIRIDAVLFEGEVVFGALPASPLAHGPIDTEKISEEAR